MRLFALTTFAAALLLGSLALPSSGAAQQAQATISGTITLATPGDTLPDGIEVQLIILEDSQSPNSASQQANSDGQFTFEVDLDPRFNYVPFLIYEDVRYFSNPSSVRFDNGTTSATVAFEVFSTTTEAPTLSIESTLVIAVSLERSTSQITLLREDVINREEATVYVGGEDEVTLRIPVPDGTISAGGVDEDDPNFSFGGGTLNVSTPLRPGVNSIVTSYTVGYDAIEDMYRLRVTSPLPTDQLEVRVPETFVDKFEPQDDQSERASDSQFEGETILAIERIGPATPGQGLIVNLIGLSGAAPAHVLTTTTGAIVGSLLALAIIVGLAAAIARRDAEALA